MSIAQIKQRIFSSSLLKSSGIYTISSLVNAAIPFLLMPLLTRCLTPEDYGIVSMFSICVAIITPFVGLSMNGAVARAYYTEEGKEDISAYV